MVKLKGKNKIIDVTTRGQSWLEARKESFMF